jgi:penicillin-binding protein 1A
MKAPKATSPSRKRHRLVLPLLLLAGVTVGVIAGVLWAVTTELPQIQALERFRPSEVTRVYSRDGVLLAELFAQKRDLVPLASMPDHLIQAILTIEDRSFYQHSGIDVRGILRAAVRDLAAGHFKEGASTISQQLTKTLFLTPRKTLMRKMREALLAFQLERRYTKDEILELYLNQIYFGSGAYGVESASRIYFGKPAADLTLAECALIAGLPKAPSRLSPLVNPDLALKRRNLVLRQMRLTGLISADEARLAAQQPFVAVNRPQRYRRAPYFVDSVRRFLEDKIGAGRLYQGGLTVRTTLDHRLQEVSEQAVANGLADLTARMRRRIPDTRLPQAALVALDVYQGDVLAMVGGRDYGDSSYNRAVDARRQPGSAFKPLLFAYAIEQGHSQKDLVLDAPIVFRGADRGEDWRPENFTKDYKGEMTLRLALALSKNIPAVRLMETLGPASVAQFAYTLGITPPLASNLSLALGTSEVSLMDLTSAYAVFANEGHRITPFWVAEVLDAGGRRIWHHQRRRQPVMTRQAAAIMTDMLTAVIQEGTGRRARPLGSRLAGKTGTTNVYKDALFVGYSPLVAAGVWVGTDDFRSLGPGETGSRAALPIWTEFMAAVVDGQSSRYFDIPDGVAHRYMDPFSGQFVAADTPGAVRALFRTGD